MFVCIFAITHYSLQIVPTYDDQGDLVFYNQLSLFMVGSGGFGGSRSSNKSDIVEAVPVPSRAPDAVVCQQTTAEQVRHQGSHSLLALTYHLLSGSHFSTLWRPKPTAH